MGDVLPGDSPSPPPCDPEDYGRQYDDGLLGQRRPDEQPHRRDVPIRAAVLIPWAIPTVVTLMTWMISSEPLLGLEIPANWKYSMRVMVTIR